jgi:hypothetical protein
VPLKIPGGKCVQVGKSGPYKMKKTKKLWFELLLSFSYTELSNIKDYYLRLIHSTTKEKSLINSSFSFHDISI